MSAGVHHSVMLRTILASARLSNRQSVHVCPESDTPCSVARLQNADNACSADSPMNLNPKFFQ